MSGFPSYVDVEFTARCNLKCGFCFGPTDDRTIPDLGFELWMNVLTSLSRRGCAGIVVSGGEPTIYPHLRDLLIHAKNLGMKIVLSTHGRHEKRLMEVVDFCDWIALPVDATTPESLLAMRGDVWGLDNAVDLAMRLKERGNGGLHIKLGTVATRMNWQEIIALADALGTLPHMPFDTWKIYQYTPRRKFASQRDVYEISDGRFNILSDGVRNTGVCERLNTVFSSHALRRRAYLFIYPDGTLAIPNEGENFSDIVLGNFAAGGDAALDIVERYALELNRANYEATYV